MLFNLPTETSSQSDGDIWPETASDLFYNSTHRLSLSFAYWLWDVFIILEPLEQKK